MSFRLWSLRSPGRPRAFDTIVSVGSRPASAGFRVVDPHCRVAAFGGGRRASGVGVQMTGLDRLAGETRPVRGATPRRRSGRGWAWHAAKPVTDLVVVGDCNPDVLVLGDDVTPAFGQEEKLVASISLAVGGSAAITALAAARLGLQVALVAAVGDDPAGQFMVAELAKESVETAAVAVRAHCPTGMTVALSQGNDRAILTAVGAIATLTAQDMPDTLLSRARHLHVSSYFLLERSLGPGLAALFSAARAAGITTSLDTNWDPAGKWGRRPACRGTGADRPLAAERGRGAADSAGRDTPGRSWCLDQDRFQDRSQARCPRSAGRRRAAAAPGDATAADAPGRNRGRGLLQRRTADWPAARARVPRGAGAGLCGGLRVDAGRRRNRQVRRSGFCERPGQAGDRPARRVVSSCTGRRRRLRTVSRSKIVSWRVTCGSVECQAAWVYSLISQPRARPGESAHVAGVVDLKEKRAYPRSGNHCWISFTDVSLPQTRPDPASIHLWRPRWLCWAKLSKLSRHVRGGNSLPAGARGTSRACAAGNSPCTMGAPRQRAGRPTGDPTEHQRPGAHLRPRARATRPPHREFGRSAGIR